MDAKEALLKEIAEYEELIRVRRRALKSLGQADAMRGIIHGRFTGTRPLAAMKTVLKEHGGRMSVEALTQALIEGGLTTGKKRSYHNIRVSIKISAKHGSLLLVRAGHALELTPPLDLESDDVVVLPETQL